MSLLHLPDELLLDISDRLDFRGISNFRKVNRHLRSLLDTYPPTHNFSFIGMETYQDGVEVNYSSQNERSYHHLYKTKNAKINRNRHKEIIGEDFVKMFSQDFKLALSYQKSPLPTLILHAEKQTSGVEEIATILKSRSKPLPVKNLELIVNAQSEALKILPFVDPDVLEAIQLFQLEQGQNKPHVPLKPEEFEHLTPWKSAAVLFSDFWIQDTSSLHHFLHFETVIVRVEKVYLKDLFMLRDILLNKTHSLIDISFNYSEFPGLDSIGQMLNVDVCAALPEHAYYKIPNSNDYLVVSVNFLMIRFERVDSEYVQYEEDSRADFFVV
ncbi:hypothetical protein CRE_04350 [Caenorhabditis remanei]|uniref:Uncharacterized protein n=1 Tax=Caenorhabditis remanei TaxID=31234 RepID=E3NIC2_CAERE|nr:hypothetical protein CRE_04350 [Caenorhabditis remanei]